MADPVDRIELRRELRDQGLYSTSVRQVVEALPVVGEESTALIRDMQADLLRVGRLNESLRLANSALLTENKALKTQIEVFNRMPKDTSGLLKKACEECGCTFYGGVTARFCPVCRGKRLSENAKANGLNKLGAEATKRKAALRRAENG